MKAQVLTAFDGPGGFELRDTDDPQITSPDEVKIRVEACGVCYRDVLWSRGKFRGGALPRILGHEGAGVVLETGSAVKHLRPGDRVVHLQFPYCGACRACQEGRPALCENIRELIGEGRNGCYADQVVLPAGIVAKLPADIEPASAAIAACGIGTAYHALRLHGFDARGKTVAVNGAGGGVGMHAVQIAKLLGASVIAITTSESKANAISSLGVDDVVVAPNGAYRKPLLKQTQGRGVDLFLEIVGASTLEQSIHAVRRGGRIVVIGNTEGGTCTLNPALLILRGELMMYGSLGVTLPELEDVLRFLAEGKLRPILGEVAPLADLPRLIQRLEARDVVGRVAVRP